MHLAAFENRVGDLRAIEQLVNRATAAGGHWVPARVARGGIRANDAEDRPHADEFEASLRAAADALRRRRGQPYASALESLPPEIREYWLGVLEEDEREPEAERKHAPTTEGLLHFLTEDALVELASQRRDTDARPTIRRQAQGENFDPDRLSSIAEWEERPDREFERNLAMLLKLQEVRMKAQNAG